MAEEVQPRNFHMSQQISMPYFRESSRASYEDHRRASSLGKSGRQSTQLNEVGQSQQNFINGQKFEYSTSSRQSRSRPSSYHQPALGDYTETQRSSLSHINSHHAGHNRPQSAFGGKVNLRSDINSRTAGQSYTNLGVPQMMHNSCINFGELDRSLQHATTTQSSHQDRGNRLS